MNASDTRNDSSSGFMFDNATADDTNNKWEEEYLDDKPQRRPRGGKNKVRKFRHDQQDQNDNRS
jgi:hypothetical protein